MKQKFLKFWKKYSLILYITLLIILGIYFWVISDSLEDFGLNFTTEMIGVAITILIVDRLGVKRESERLLPIKMVVYKETSLLFNRFLSLLFDLYSQTIEKAPPTDTESFLKSNVTREAFIFV